MIGGGPAGLTNAYFLRRLGHAVTIFDMMPKLGGMIRYGIPEYRLPKEVLEWEIDGILNLGIEHRPNVKLGDDFTLADLETEGFDAVFMGIGAWRDYSLKVEGEDLKGCYTGIDFLTKFALNQQADQRPTRSASAASARSSAAATPPSTACAPWCGWGPKRYRSSTGGHARKCRPTRSKSSRPSTRASSFTSWPPDPYHRR